MRTEFAPSYPVSLFIAGNYDAARDACQAHCEEEGLCVTVTPTTYVYTGGEEAGVIVGLINYPRFPSEPGVPRYTVTPGAALNMLVGWTDATLAAMTKGEE